MDCCKKQSVLFAMSALITELPQATAIGEKTRDSLHISHCLTLISELQLVEQMDVRKQLCRVDGSQ